jgi:hypothetical protein
MFDRLELILSPMALQHVATVDPPLPCRANILCQNQGGD